LNEIKIIRKGILNIAQKEFKTIKIDKNFNLKVENGIITPTADPPGKNVYQLSFIYLHIDKID